MVDKIEVTIKRTFTRDDDPFGLFSLFEVAGNLDNALAELRYDVLHGDLSNAVVLLDDAAWTIDAQRVDGATTIFDLAPLSYWRQKRSAAQVAIAQGLARDRLRLMLIIEVQRLQLQRAQQQRDELLTLLRQRMDDAKSRNTAAKAGGTEFDVAVEFGRYAAYSDVKWMIDAQGTMKK